MKDRFHTKQVIDCGGIRVNGQPLVASEGGVDTAALADGAVTAPKLADAVKPSHVVKFAGVGQWSGSGASKAFSVPGVLATDIVVASFLTAPTEAAYIKQVVPTTDTVTVTLSAANTTNDAKISYVVFRAVA